MSFYQPLPSTHFPSTAMVDEEPNFFDFSVPKTNDQLSNGHDFFENFESSSSWYPNYHNVRSAHPAHSFSAPLLAPNYDYQFASASQLSSWPLQEQTTSYISRSASPPLAVEAMPQSWCPSSPSSNDETSNIAYSSPALSDDSHNMFETQFQHANQRRQATFTTGSLRRHSKSRSTSPAIKKNNSSDDESAQRRRHPCLTPGCSRRFTSQYTLKVHMDAHKPKPRVSFPCTLGCREWFSRQHDRLRHEVAKHNKVCEFSCTACGRFFSTEKTLGNHKCPLAQGETRWVHQ